MTVSIPLQNTDAIPFLFKIQYSFIHLFIDYDSSLKTYLYHASHAYNKKNK